MARALLRTAAWLTGLALVAAAAAPETAGPARAREVRAERGRRPWAFLRQHGTSAVFEAKDARLYRELLPEPLEMPDRLLVQVTFVHYDEVTPALVPYHEAYVMLHCRHRGEAGLFPLTMPVDERTANEGGRQIGFPKYVAERIVLVEEKAGMRAEVIHDGQPVIAMRFTPREGAAAVETTSSDPGLPCFTFVETNAGRKLVIVRRSLLGERRRVETEGRASVTTSEPWGRLLDQAQAVSARREEITGDSVFVLTWR